MKGRLVLKDVGPFKDIELELKPITVICGVPGTGKTFMLKLLHAVINAASEYLLSQSSSIPGFAISLMAYTDFNIRRGFVRKGSEEAYLKLVLEDEESRPRLQLELRAKTHDFHLDITSYSATSVGAPIRSLLVTHLTSCVRVLINITQFAEFVCVRARDEEGLSLAHKMSKGLVEKALKIVNDLVKDYGEFTVTQCNIVCFVSRTGYKIVAIDAPDILQNIFNLVVTTVAPVELEPYTVILVDDLDNIVAPPLTELCIRTVLDYILREKDAKPMLVLAVRNLDTFVLVANTALNILRSLGKNPEDYVVFYELKHRDDHVVAEKLPITELGVKLPEYLVNYAKTIVQTSKLVS